VVGGEGGEGGEGRNWKNPNGHHHYRRCNVVSQPGSAHATSPGNSTEPGKQRGILGVKATRVCWVRCALE